MQTYSLNCIKCSTKYETTDSDPYLCSPCNEERKRIALEVDKKLAGRVTKNVKNNVQIMDELKRTRGIRARGIVAVHMKDLGL